MCLCKAAASELFDLLVDGWLGLRFRHRHPPTVLLYVCMAASIFEIPPRPDPWGAGDIPSPWRMPLKMVQSLFDPH
jgi:hypothetical protein